MDYKMDYKPSFPNPTSKPTTTPRLILHGGSGNLTRSTLSPAQWLLYRTSLLRILRSTYSFLLSSPTISALSAAVHAVTLLENDPLFNCGKGAVFTRTGHNELEASVMVSRGSVKRGCAVSMLRHVKNPIKLAEEVLLRGEREGGGGAQGHVHLSGEYVEGLAREWGFEMAEEEYFWTQARWEEHLRGLERERTWERRHPLGEKTAFDVQVVGDDDDDSSGGDPTWDPNAYLPQGTVGCVVLDAFGTLAVATSTGGITNKLPGRIGDTPTMGAGFWAEQWDVVPPPPPPPYPSLFPSLTPPNIHLPPAITTLLSHGAAALSDCLPAVFPHQTGETRYTFLPSSSSSHSPPTTTEAEAPPPPKTRAVAMSGTGNGDSFLKLNAVRTVAAVLRFSSPTSPLPHPASTTTLRLYPTSHSTLPSSQNPHYHHHHNNPHTPTLATAITRMAGPNGELQRSAGDRWGKTGEGLAGIIGIEVLTAGEGGGRGEGKVCADFNMGMFRAWVDEEGGERVMVFREEY